MLLPLLRQRTRDAHQAIETAINPMRPDFNHADYVQYLQKMERFYTVWEASVLPLLSQYPELIYRTRVQPLRHDLSMFGELPLPASHGLMLPVDPVLPELLGMLYVVEGSTLGGVMIAKHLQNTLDLSPACFHFLMLYGKETAAHWRIFGKAAEKLAASFEEKERAQSIHAAHKTFQAMQDWYLQPDRQAA